MGIRSDIVDLATHFPPSNYLGRAGNQFWRQPITDREIYFDGVVLFPNGNDTHAHWRSRVVSQRRVGWDRVRRVSQCEVRGFAQLKGFTRAKVDEPVFLETMRDGDSPINKTIRYLAKQYPALSFQTDRTQRRGLLIEAANEIDFVPERLSEEVLSGSVCRQPSLLAPYATICVDQAELNLIQKSSIAPSNEIAFSLLDGNLSLHARTWQSPKSAGASFGRFGGKNTVNALTKFEEFFEVDERVDTPDLLAETAKKRRARIGLERLSAASESARRATLSHIERAREDFSVFSLPNGDSPYAVVSYRKLRSCRQDGEQFYVPSQDAADWFPSRVVRDILSTKGLTTIHLRPRMLEVVKETPSAIYKYFVCGTGIWDWYQKHQPARYFRGVFEGSRLIASVG